MFHVHSDTSKTGITCVFDVRRKKNIRFFSLSSIKHFENKCIFWYTNNFVIQQIIKCVSNETHIHSLSLNIFNLTFDHNIHLLVFWVRRKYNKEADKCCRTVAFHDWYATQQLINFLEQRCGKISIDRFASDVNRESKRFNSRYLYLETEGINAFSFDW